MNADSEWDVVIVGSGFGGSINALRLAQAGKRVLVLERGQEWQPADFPRDTRDTDRLLWRHPRRRSAQGLYDVRFFSGIGVVAASGVGGGSLVYASIHIRPDAEVFENERWPAAIRRATLDPYYDKVAQMLGISPVPAALALKKREVFLKAAHEIDRTTFDPDQAVDWNRCVHCAECEFGCVHGAKNTLDFNYLAQARQAGAEIRARASVSRVEPAAGGSYRVHYENLAEGTPASVVGKRVVLSAGTLGTNEILLRSRGNLQRLSPCLGRGFSGNGDFLGSIQGSAEDLRPWHGPDVTSVMRFTNAQPPFTLAAPSFSRPAMEVLASLGQTSPRWLRPFAGLIWPWLNQLLPLAMRFGALAHPSSLPMPHAGPPERMTNLFAIGRDNANGLLSLKKDRLDITWDYARENADLVKGMLNAMTQLGGAYGGRFAPLVTWEAFRRILTVHPLGGCALSDTPETGVVSPTGEVHGHAGLFVADGSVIPAAIGFHPVMTISAIAERIAENVIASF
jgi:cholesterol oxidase